LRVGPRLTIPDAELVERFSRSSGPGGQGVNTTDSRVELEWDHTTSTALDDHQRARLRGRLGDGPTRVVATEHRSQLRNRETARERLVDLLRDALAPPAPRRRPTRPTRGSRERRLAAKKQRGDVKRLRGRIGGE
jgi:ribosome-associated protein